MKKVINGMEFTAFNVSLIEKIRHIGTIVARTLFLTSVNVGACVEGKTITLDGLRVKDCYFERCRILYSGGPIYADGCSFICCDLILCGAARNGVIMARLFEEKEQ